MSKKSSSLSQQARWAALGTRERRGLLVAVVLVAAAVLWQFLVAPTLVTLRTADTQARALDTQLQQMLALQKQAKALQTQPALGFDDALRALTQATQQTLGNTADIFVTADRAKVTLKGASADSLARWLSQARLNARSLPVDARLTSTTTPAGTAWSGVLVMGLPAR
jgi:general secretion pathway protein M